jgi:hypothetical protein
MDNLLITPAIPHFLAAVAGAILAGIGLLLLDRRRVAAAGMYLLPSPASMSGRYLLGSLAGAPAAAIPLLAVVVGGFQGMNRLLLIAGALGVYLYVALVIPRKPIVAQQKAALKIRRLTPGFISFVRVSTSSFESPLDTMRRYVSRPVSQLAAMQELVADALQVGIDQRLRPFAALASVSRQRGCRELIEVAEALSQAEAEGGRIDSVLEAQQATLELILQSEFKRMLSRRTMYLLMMVAISLVVGILINLLYIMTGGGSVFSTLNG